MYPLGASVNEVFEGDAAKTSAWIRKGRTRLETMFASANGGFASKTYSPESGVTIECSVNGNLGRLRIESGGVLYLYRSYVTAIGGVGNRTATFDTLIPAVGGTLKFNNIHTYAGVQEVYRKPVFKTSGRNTVWGFSFENYPSIPNTWAVSYYVVKLPDDASAHPKSDYLTFSGSETQDGLPVHLVPKNAVQGMCFAVFLTAGGYACYSCVRYGGDNEYQQIVLTYYNKDNAFTGTKTWLEDTLFYQEFFPSDAFGSYYIPVIHWQEQGQGDYFYGVVFKLRFVGAATLGDARYEMALSTNLRKLANPAVELVRMSDAIAFATVDANPENGAGYGAKYDYGMAYISNVIEYSGKLFVTLGVWQYSAVSFPVDILDSDIGNMPNYNGGYAYHTVVFDVVTGNLLATHHNTGIGEWEDTDIGLVGLTVGNVYFSEVNASTVKVMWNIAIVQCQFNEADATKLEVRPVQTRGYSGVHSANVAFIAGYQGCWLTANKWSKSCSTHLMHKYK